MHRPHEKNAKFQSGNRTGIISSSRLAREDHGHGERVQSCNLYRALQLQEITENVERVRGRVEMEMCGFDGRVGARGPRGVQDEIIQESKWGLKRIKDRVGRTLMLFRK